MAWLLTSGAGGLRAAVRRQSWRKRVGTPCASGGWRCRCGGRPAGYWDHGAPTPHRPPIGCEDLVLAPSGVVGKVEDVLPRGGQVGADGKVLGVLEEALAGGILPQAVGEAGHGVEPVNRRGILTPLGG